MPKPQVPRLFALLQLYRGGDWLTVAHDFHFDDVTDFAAAKRIGEVVEILDRLAAEFDQDVSRLSVQL